MASPASDAWEQQLARRNTGQLLRLPYETFIARLLDALAAAGYTDLNAAHALLFQHLRAEGERVTELAVRMRLTKQYVGRLVAELEALGYLERMVDPADARARPVRLSARGQELTRVAEGVIAALEADWQQRLGGGCYTELRRQLIDLILTLEA